MQTIADRTPRELGGALSVLVRQRRDHERLDALLDELGQTRGTAAEEAVLRRVYRLVFSHAFAEEAVLWPVLRRLLPDGEALTLQVEQEHQEVNELVTRLDSGTPGDPGRDELLDRLVEVLREDVRDEEDALLPRLRDQVGDLRLRLLGVAWEAVRRIASTRPHPTVARRPPGNAIAALPLTVLDRLRDLVGLVGDRVPRPLGSVLALLDGVLATGAGAVERIPLLRRGEDPSTHRPPTRPGLWGRLRRSQGGQDSEPGQAAPAIDLS